MNNAFANSLPYQSDLPIFDDENQEDATEFRSDDDSSNIVWKPKNRVYKPGVVGLHEEIIDFTHFICPTHEEHWVREIVVGKVKNVIYALWPGCRVDVFGSFSTGLYLPTSDIDVVVFGKWSNLPLSTLENALKSSKTATDIKVLSKATVPIVKLTDSDTGLRVDISFNMINSIRAATMIRQYIHKYPCLHYLVFVLKQFLYQRDLNEVWTGGISSYALILMCISFLQHNAKEEDSAANVNLGTLLMEFFELYGRNFNYMTTAISITGNGSYLRKELVKNMDPGCGPSILCIEDPICPGNNVGRRSYGALQVRQAFEYAYLALSSALCSDAENGKSILSKILHISPATLDCRSRVQTYALFLCRFLPNFMPVNPVYSHPPRGVAPHTAASSLVHSAPLSHSSSPPQSKEPTVVSARGFSTRPPTFLRAPIGGELLALSPHPPPFAYQQPQLYDRPGFSMTNPSDTVFLILPQTVMPPPDQLHCTSATAVAVSLSVKGEPSASLSQPLLDTLSESNTLESGIGETCEQVGRRNSSTSEDPQKTKDLLQQSADRNSKTGRSASASNPGSNLANQLAPLRLTSSAQNVCSPCENDGVDVTRWLSPQSRPQQHEIPKGKTMEYQDCERMEADSCSSPQPPLQPPQLQGSKSIRRRRRALRRGRATNSVVADANSTFPVNTSKIQTPRAAISNGCFSSNESEEGGCTAKNYHGMKRRCSQLQVEYCCGDKSDSKVSSNTTNEHQKAWSSFTSVRTNSGSSALRNDQSGGYFRLPTVSPTAPIFKGGKKTQKSNDQAHRRSLALHDR